MSQTTPEQKKSKLWHKLPPPKEVVFNCLQSLGRILATGSDFFSDTDAGKELRMKTRAMFKDTDENGSFACPAKFPIPSSVVFDAPPPPDENIAKDVWMRIWRIVRRGEFFQANPQGEIVRYQVRLALFQLSRWRWEPAQKVLDRLSKAELERQGIRHAHSFAII